PRPRSPPHARRGVGAGRPPHEPHPGATRALIALDDEPLPRAHCAHGTDSSNARPNLAPLSGSWSGATIGVRSSNDNRTANPACRRHGERLLSVNANPSLLGAAFAPATRPNHERPTAT